MSGETQKLALREKISYGFGDLASVLYWQTFMLYFTYFYTDVFLIPAAAAANMFLISRIWDGINDPMMGMIADRTKSRWGKFRPYLLWLCVPFAFVGVLTFTVPDLGQAGKMVWAYVTFIAIMMLYTAINIPYTALLGVISADSKERTTVSSVKFLFAFAAGIIVSATLLPMVKNFGGGDESIIRAQVSGQTIRIHEVGKGNARVIVTAEDPKGLTGTLDFGFRVIPANNNLPALVHPISDVKLESGFDTYPIDISSVFKGNNEVPFEYSVENQNEGVVEVELKDTILHVKEIKAGNSKITLTAKDRLWGGKTTSFFIHVLAKGNHEPVLENSTSSIELKSGFETEQIDLSAWITDPDGDKLSIEAESSNPKVLSTEIRDNKLTLIEVDSGIAYISIIAADDKGGRLTHTIKYFVSTAENNPPYVNASADTVDKMVGFGTYELDVSNLFADKEGEPLMYRVKVTNEARGWQYSFIVYGVAAVLFFLIAFKGTRERIQPPKAQTSSVKKDIFELVTNVPWLVLLAVTITFILFVAVKGSVTVHYFKYYVGSQKLSLPFLKAGTYGFEELTSAYNTIGQISAFLGVLLVSWFANIVGKKTAFVTLFVIAIASTGAVYFLRANQISLLFLLQITGSMTGGPLSVLLWAMYADTADYAEWKRGRRATGLVFSASTMSQKFGWAFGAFVALTLMSQVGFQANQVQSKESLRGLILLFSMIPAGLGVFSMILSLVYPLNEKRVERIEAELKERRNAEGQSIATV
jgi:Na+/melibiose symporter-like transporter